jgi:hypothetical protein
MPWLLVAGDDFFKVPAKIFIQRDRRLALPRLFQDFGDGPPAATRRTDQGHGPMIFLLDNYFASLFDLRQHRAYIAGKFGFCNAQCHPVFLLSIIAVYSAFPAIGFRPDIRIPVIVDHRNVLSS